ncbi:hypothetical protein AB5N19_06709 [Seiridium cardinale]|uniref:Uncharacterized protein n=1 Tax=Seiridium cardinale TaxID=138064 RepID=A0ABR2XKR0_9PEZI
MESSMPSTSLQPGSMHAELAPIVDSTSQPSKAPAAGNCALQDGKAQHSSGESPKMFPVDADPEFTPPDDDSRNSPALRAYLMQLDLLDKQNKKRIQLSRQGLDTPTADGDEQSPLQEKMISRNHALQGYQVRLKFLEQQNKKRLLVSGASNLLAAKADQAEDLPSGETREDSPAQHDYQSQLLLLEEQKKRLRKARAEQDLSRAKLDEGSEPLSDEKPKHPYTYWPQPEELDRRFRERKKQAEQSEQQSEDGHSVPDPSPVLEKLQSILLEDAETVCQGAEGPRCQGELPGNYVKEDFTDIAASILSNVLRSPHDMNALFDENTPKRAKLESTLVQHDESAVDAALRRQHDLQKLQQSQKPTSPSASTSTSNPGFAPASFEYKGPSSVEIVEPPPPPPPPRRSCGYGVFSMRMERSRKPAPSPDAADCERSMVDTFKNDNPAVVAQLKQIGSRRRSRRGQSSTTSPPRNTPISRIRGKAVVAAAGQRSPSMPSNGLPSPPPSQTNPSLKSVEVDRADISCPEGVSLAIRLRVNV